MKDKERELIFEVAGMAGDILLRSGAEISRVDETMRRIACAYELENVSTFVLSNGIFLTSETEGSNHQVRVRHIPLAGARLDRIDAVNELSREIELGFFTPTEAKAKLKEIEKLPQKPGWHQILAAGIGSGAFCFLFGGDVLDSLAAFQDRHQRQRWSPGHGADPAFLPAGLRAPSGSHVCGGAASADSGSGLYELDPGFRRSGLYRWGGTVTGHADCDFQHRPGRGPDDDVVRNRRQLMILRLIEEGIAAGIGTIAFALMFHVPKQYYLCGGVAGAAGWLVYRALELNVNSLMGPVFAGAFTVVFLSRIFAVRKKCPVTMFLIPGIFPLVPGMGIYQTAQALVGSDWDLAASKGLTSIKFAVAIVGGILLGFEIPQRWFSFRENKVQKTGKFS